ncbi:hypothetical protein BC827DRAFT_674813 [Russula dissimulans]|nr:hypothetical protein BC827DRAFT_674813 [Russula dissimulans]
MTSIQLSLQHIAFPPHDSRLPWPKPWPLSALQKISPYIVIIRVQAGSIQYTKHVSSFIMMRSFAGCKTSTLALVCHFVPFIVVRVIILPFACKQSRHPTGLGRLPFITTAITPSFKCSVLPRTFSMYHVYVSALRSPYTPSSSPSSLSQC